MRYASTRLIASAQQDQQPTEPARSIPRETNTSSHVTLRWREMDSNFRSPVSGETPERPGKPCLRGNSRRLADSRSLERSAPISCHSARHRWSRSAKSTAGRRSTRRRLSGCCWRRKYRRVRRCDRDSAPPKRESCLRPMYGRRRKAQEQLSWPDRRKISTEPRMVTAGSSSAIPPPDDPS
jgi:hypothetical protein